MKIEGLGTFYTTVECTKGGAVSADKFNVNKHIKGLHIRFLPEQEQEQNISSREFLKQAEFINVDSLVKKDEDAEGGGSQSGNGGSGTGDGSQSQGSGESQGGDSQGGSQSGGQNQPATYVLSINTTGSGTATVTKDGNVVAPGSSLSEDDEVEISITPAEGETPSATINGSSIELTESEGVYTGSFAMPGQISTLAINTGGSGGDGGADLDKD